MSADSDPQSEDDVYLTVYLHGLRMDYRAHATAAHVFLREWTAHHGTHTAAILPSASHDLPRLPCERLYREP